MSGPAIVIVIPLERAGAATARLLVESAEEEASFRRILAERDVVAEVAFAVGEVLRALDDRHDDDEGGDAEVVA